MAGFPPRISFPMIVDPSKRPEFPEHAKDFFDFFLTTLRKRFLNQQLNERTIDEMKSEALQMLSVANTLYDLRVQPGFWVVDIQGGSDDRETVISPMPRSLLSWPVALAEHKDGGYAAWTGPDDEPIDLVRGPSILEALVGLGKLYEAKYRAG